MKGAMTQYFLGYYPLSGGNIVPLYQPPRGSVFPDSYLKTNPNFVNGGGGAGFSTVPAVQLTANPSGNHTTYVIDKARIQLAGDVGAAVAGPRAFGLEIANAGGSLGIVAMGAVYLAAAPQTTPGVLWDSGLVDFGPFGAGPNNILGGNGDGVRLGPNSYVYLTSTAPEQISGTFYVLLMYHAE